MQSDTALGWETELLYSFPMSPSVRVFRPLLPLSFFLFFWVETLLSQQRPVGINASAWLGSAFNQ